MPEIGPALPKRLLFVGPPQDPELHLIEATQDCPTYMTLIYCRGLSMPQESLTTSSDFIERFTKISFDTLPPKICDAIEIDRSLAAQYLWIDAINIIQDSQENWTSESVNMGGIYQNSLLTIAASKAADSPEGCFNDVEPATGKCADQNEATTGVGIESKEEIKPEEKTAKEEEAGSEVAESQTQDNSKGIAFEIVESNKSDSRTMLRLLSTMFNTQPLKLELSPLKKRG